MNATLSLDATEVMSRLYDESRRGRLAQRRAVQDVPRSLRFAPDDRTETRIALPPPLAASDTLRRSLEARAAVRTYDATPIDVASLGTMLHAAGTGDRQDWPAEQDAGVDLRLVVVAWRVDGLEPGVWRYDAETHALVRTGDAPAPEDAPTLTLQLEFTTAPALIFIAGGLAAACARYGSWGHRQLLLRGGAAGQRLWLAALGMGLAGSVFAGFLPRAADRFARLDGYLQASLLGFATGYAEYADRGPAAATNRDRSQASPGV
jgi:SagB-type dehydrogenase family enzyme